MEENVRHSVGYYLRPFRWIGENPIPNEGSITDTSKCVEDVLNFNLSNSDFDIVIRVSRDGLFLFEFKRIRLVESTKKGKLLTRIVESPINPQLLEFRMPISRILNAHLALLRLATIKYVDTQELHKHNLSNYSNSPSDLWFQESSSDERGSGHAMFGGRGDLDNGIFHTRALLSFVSNPSPISKVESMQILRDFLRSRRLFAPVPLAIVKTSFEFLESVLSNKSVEKPILLLELLAKSFTALSDEDYDWAIMTAWAGIESALSDWWIDFIKSNNKRKDVKRSTRTVLVQGMDEFIDSKRKERLEDSNVYSAAVRLEILSWANELDTNTYNILNKVRKCRNDWIHNLKHASIEDAQTAVSALISMLNHVYDLDLR